MSGIEQGLNHGQSFCALNLRAMRLQVMCEQVRNHLKRIYVFAGKEIAAKGLGKLPGLFFLATKSLLPFQITKMIN